MPLKNDNGRIIKLETVETWSNFSAQIPVIRPKEPIIRAALMEKKIIDPSKVFTDYIGPTVGTTQVIKGSNHYSSTSLQLGLSYRTYGNGPNELIGFRVARWIY